MSTTKHQPVLLQIDNLESYYGPIMAIRGVSLKVHEGPDRHRPWGQRRGQDHAAQDHLGRDGP